MAACSESTKPPYIRAQVIDVYNNKTDIYNAHLLYWWQERGETAFLDTYNHTGRVLMVSEVKSNNAGHSGGSLVPCSFPLSDIGKIEWVITEAGKQMYVHTTAGAAVETQCLFPQELRIDPASGLADFKLYITGSTGKNVRSFDFRQDIDFVRTILITGIETQRH
ncbi:MAG: hypothetical protein FJ119_13900 [Deltaproteobacteria bacterium]|nr:hypothetical protein [Deltaproteobacteria bacterium]